MTVTAGPRNDVDIDIAGTRDGVRSGLRAVLGLARPWRKDLRYGIASGITQQVLFIAGAAVAGYAVARAVRGATYGQIGLYLLSLVILVLPQVRTPWLEAISLQALANRIQVRLRGQIFDALERLTPGGLAGRRSGELGSAAMADVAVIQRFFAETMSTLIVAASVPIFAVVALALLSWQLAAALLPLLILAAVVPLWLRHRAERQAPAIRDEVGALSADIVDAVQGLREVVTFGAQATVLAELAARGRRVQRLRASQRARAATARVAGELLAAGGTVVVLGAGAALVTHHDLGATLLPPAVIVAALSFGPVARLVDATAGLGGLGGVMAASERVFALVDAPAPVLDRPTAVAVDGSGAPAVRFCDVRFRYRPDLPDALSGVSFSVAKGETVALVGHSGAGKSTCVNLLLRFWDARAGAVTLGGIDVRDLGLADLRRLVGFVPQDVYLFNTTVRDNLRLGRPEATDTEIEAAARAALAWEVVAALPDRLDTHTGERAVQLSGGQRQRLAIARSFLADPPVLVLDEPVSNLDIDNEQALTQAMGRLRAGRTTIIVAHRLSTIRAADRVVVLDHGRVVETGTHRQLIARDGVYARLIAGQMAPDIVIE